MIRKILDRLSGKKRQVSDDIPVTESIQKQPVPARDPFVGDMVTDGGYHGRWHFHIVITHNSGTQYALLHQYTLDKRRVGLITAYVRSGDVDDYRTVYLLRNGDLVRFRKSDFSICDTDEVDGIWVIDRFEWICGGKYCRLHKVAETSRGLERDWSEWLIVPQGFVEPIISE